MIDRALDEMLRGPNGRVLRWIQAPDLVVLDTIGLGGRFGAWWRNDWRGIAARRELSASATLSKADDATPFGTDAAFREVFSTEDSADPLALFESEV